MPYPPHAGERRRSADLGERLRAETRQEAERLRSDPDYAAEMRAVHGDMESVRAW